MSVDAGDFNWRLKKMKIMLMKKKSLMTTALRCHLEQDQHEESKGNCCVPAGK